MGDSLVENFVQAIVSQQVNAYKQAFLSVTEVNFIASVADRYEWLTRNLRVFDDMFPSHWDVPFAVYKQVVCICIKAELQFAIPSCNEVNPLLRLWRKTSTFQKSIAKILDGKREANQIGSRVRAYNCITDVLEHLQKLADLEENMTEEALKGFLAQENWEGLPTSNLLESSENMFFFIQQRIRDWAGLSQGAMLYSIVCVWRRYLIVYALHLVGRLPPTVDSTKELPLPVVKQVCVLINSAQWWAGLVDNVMERAGFPQGDTAMQAAKEAFGLVASKGMDYLAAVAYVPIQRWVQKLIQGPGTAKGPWHAECVDRIEEVLSKQMQALGPVVCCLSAGPLAFCTTFVSLVVAKMLAQLYQRKQVPSKDMGNLLSAALQLSSHLKDLPYSCVPEEGAQSAPDMSDFGTHVEKEMLRLQHLLVLIEMPPELVVDEYCSLMPNPSGPGLTKVLQMRGASEADITIALEHFQLLGPGHRDTPSPPPALPWLAGPSPAALTMGPFKGERLPNGQFRISEGQLVIHLKREKVFNTLWSFLVAAYQAT
uniref:Vps53 N-terminal domain-containing protein n=1 Tax=Eutreptiella gymnastica TaxID=73025 RepID=A0A7S1HVE7_9EUGL